ncbi:ankyrin repeat and BTB/POZ domain-containing protein 3-like [Saccostrea cucullata]|uniref:ankyrin repeat and BTB/POZ domain-containing protein 3-like n=1 Tax=Saccostrea cuccullata TaxID=36930 RepID=UPI002ED086F4
MSLDIKTERAVDEFPEEPGVTDIAFVVEGRKIYTFKTILSIASPVFKAMFSSDFKEKSSKEIELPGKTYRDFEKFLMCLSPDKYLDLNEGMIERLLPLAKEYQVNSIIRRCEAWLLKEMNQREKCDKSMEGEVKFLLKSYFYGSEYNMPKIRARTFKRLVRFKLRSYKSVQSYKELSEKDKIELLEARINEVDSLYRYCQYCDKSDYFLGRFELFKE